MVVVSGRVIACELFICLPDFLKSDFGEVDESMFQGVESPGENIFYIFDIQNATWTKSQKCFN
jgi:hypothetical protein